MPHQCTNCEHVFADGSKEMLSGCPECGGNTFQYLPDGAADVPEEAPPDRPGTDSTVAETVGRAATTLRDVVSGGDDAAAGGRGDATRDEPADRAGPDEPTGETANDDPVDDGAAGDERSDEADPVTGSDESAGPPDPFPAEADPRTDAEFVDSEPPEEASTATDAPEDLAQSSARTDVVSEEDLPDGMAGVGHSPAAGSSEADAAGSSPAGSDRSAAVGEGPEPPGEGRVVDTPSEDRPDLEELRQELNDQFEGIRIAERGQYELNLMELYEREETIIALKENGRYVIEPPETWRGES